MEQRGLLERVERLERTNRWLGASLVFAVATGALVGFTQKQDEVVDVLKARALMIYSADNKLVIDARYDKWTQGGAVTILDHDGERRSWWRASPAGAHLMMMGTPVDPANEPSSVIVSTFRNRANIAVWGTGPFATLIADGDKDPLLTIYGKGKESVFSTASNGK